MVTNQNELKNLERLLSSDGFNMPLVLVTDSEDEKSDSGTSFHQLRNTLSVTGFGSTSFTENILADTSKVKIESSAVKIFDKKPERSAPKPVPEVRNTPRKKQPVFDYKWLASKTMCFSVICFISENCFDHVRNKLGIAAGSGEIIILDNGKEYERIRYSAERFDKLKDKLKAELRNMLKRSAFSYGGIQFYSDARLSDLRERRNESLSLEDRLNSYKQENSELRAHNHELVQQNNDLRFSIENERVLSKQVKKLSSENDALRLFIKNSSEDFRQKEDAYRRAAGLVSFYRQKCFDSADFPTDKNNVCSWAKKIFSGNILISARAEASLRKCSSNLETAVLYDGIYFLNAYAGYRKGELSADELSLYAESYNWEVTGCGSVTLRVRHSDYEFEFDDKKYLLDMHLKHGVSSRSLIRIYFCWDSELKKLIIGHMPDHLPTATQAT